VKLLGRKSVSSILRVLVEIAWYGLILAAVILLAAGVLTLFDVSPPGMRLSLWTVPFEIDPGVYQIRAGELGTDGRIVDATGELLLDDPARGLTLAVVLGALVGVGFGLVAIDQLRRIFRTLTAGEPFVGENVRRIRVIAGIIIGLEILEAVVRFASSLFLRSHLASTGITLRSDLNLQLGAIFAGLVLLVLAEVFRIGTELREDQALTI